MTQILYLTHTLSVIAATFLVASLWQGLVVTACVALLLRLFPGLTAAVRSALWIAVLLMVILFPALSIALRHSSASTVSQIHLLHVSDRWCLALLVAWAVSSLFRASQLAASALRLQRIAARAIAITPSEPIATLLHSSNRHVDLCSSTEVDRPSVAGFFHPRILLSPELLSMLSAPELEQVVLHEMEHLRRYDDWTNLLQKLSLALIPLHPVLLWLDRQLCLQRELACDDRVLRHTRSRKSYASCLARLAEDSIVRRGFSLALGALGNRERTSELANRVHRILRAPEKTMTGSKSRLATATLLTLTFTGTALLARSPQFISFASTPRTLASTPFLAAPDVEPASVMTNVIYRPSTSHAMHLKAIVPEPNVSSSLLATAHKPSQSSRHMPLTRNIVQHSSRTPRPYFTLTAWRSIATPTRSMPASDQSDDFQGSQILYAAVPTSDGWLIIQL